MYPKVNKMTTCNKTIVLHNLPDEILSFTIVLRYNFLVTTNSKFTPDSPNRWAWVYQERASAYELLVAREDHQGNLLAAIQSIFALEGAQVVEFGAGTGRVTTLLAPRAAQVWAFDLTLAMAQVAAHKRQLSGCPNGLIAQADSRQMPLPSACADLAIEGWSFLQIAVWHMSAWRQHFGMAIDEMLRVLRPGGTAILIETLGTGVSSPNPPEQFLPMYAYLEQERGFTRQCIRTDYRFASREETQTLMEAVFGNTMVSAWVETPQGIELPECTGIWWLKT
jgi:ubiquinone/menaquinone biosynthesis C-methylase UbiE